MQQNPASFWAEIKKFEEQLLAAPDSFCFARLAEVYLKVGLVDDALHAAQKGVARHPSYLAGQRALAMACQAKGLTSECIQALKQVVDVMPEDVDAQKHLGRLLSTQGDYEAAAVAFRTVQEFAPDDIESRVELDAIERSSNVIVSQTDEDEIIEELELLEELEIVEDDLSEETKPTLYPEPVPVQKLQTNADPLSTATLAELYATQGFADKAIDIYRTILAVDPNDSNALGRIAELGHAISPTQLSSDTYADGVEVADISAQTLDDRRIISDFTLSDSEPGVTTDALIGIVDGLIDSNESVVAHGISDNALETLEGWLENIRRIKSCR